MSNGSINVVMVVILCFHPEEEKFLNHIHIQRYKNY